jgi:hypothetical protein
LRSREGLLEDYFDAEVVALGGKTYKWTPPRGLDGVPDRIVMLSNRAWFVEMKNHDGTLRPSQKNLLPKMSQYHDVFVVYGHAGVDSFIEEELQSWLNVRSETTFTALSALIKGLKSVQIKQAVGKRAESVLTAVAGLLRYCIPSLKFYPSSKEKQLKRKSDS